MATDQVQYSLHERLKQTFREFERTPTGQKYKQLGWYPEAADLADAVIAFLQNEYEVVIDLTDHQGAQHEQIQPESHT